MQTLPGWFWIIYYIFLCLSLISGMINWVRQRLSALSALTIILSLLVPTVSFVYTVGRTMGLNEFEYIFAQMKTRDIWAIFLTAGYLYLLVWWYFFVSSFIQDGAGHRLGKLLHSLKIWIERKLLHNLKVWIKRKLPNKEREKDEKRDTE